MAAKLQYASVKNSAGNVHRADPGLGASAAGKAVTVNPDLTFKAYNSPAPQAYPITYQTYVIIYQDQPASTGALMKAYTNYLITTGQKMLPDLDFAPLPDTSRRRR